MSAPIHQEAVFSARPERIYEALMDSRQHAEFTDNGAAEISREAGGAFTIHGGAIEGRNIELVPNRRIVQAWRVKDWPEGMYTVIRFELKGEGDKTRIVFDHWGAPEDAREHLAEGWRTRYWEPLEKYLG